LPDETGGIRQTKETVPPLQLISGEDLIQLGLVPGPVFKQILEYIEDAQLEGTVRPGNKHWNLYKKFKRRCPLSKKRL
jgi:poly(A) polymerase